MTTTEPPWERLTRWLDPTAAIGDLTAREWIEQEQRRIRSRHLMLVTKEREDGLVALFSAGLLADQPSPLLLTEYESARHRQDTEREIPEEVPDRPQGGHMSVRDRAWRLGYLAATEGVPAQACPHGRSAATDYLRAEWMEGHGVADGNGSGRGTIRE